MDKEKLPLLVARAQAGDNQALNDLFTETYNDVYYFSLKTVKDETLAADITQETFVTIFKNINSLNDPIAYPAWSRQITYRNCLQYLKKQNRETTVEENEDGSTIFDTIQEDRENFIPDKNLDKEDFKKTILDIVDSLPEEQRTAVILYYYDELSVKQIAEIQGVTEGTVKSRLNYARKTIKSSVESYEKKNNVKLHSVGVLPMLLWLFGADAKACTLPTATATTIASGVSTATGTTISVSKLVHISSKLFGALWQKIVAGVLATAIVVGGITIAFVIKNNNDKTVQKPNDSLQQGTVAHPNKTTELDYFSEIHSTHLVNSIFTNNSKLLYFSNPDELDSSDAFWLVLYAMLTDGDISKYLASDEVECFVFPIEDIYTCMEECLGRTYDCSNIIGENREGFIIEGVNKTSIRVVRDEKQYKAHLKEKAKNNENLSFKVIENNSQGDVRKVITCWYKTYEEKPTEKDSNWYYDENTNQYLVVEKYCEIILKPLSNSDHLFFNSNWYISSYQLSQNQDYEFTP